MKEERHLEAGNSKLVFPIKEPKPVEHVTNEYLQNVLKNGLPGLDTRNRKTYYLAIYLKDNHGFDRERTRRELYEFTEREYTAGRTEDNLRSARSDIDYTVDNVYNNDKHLPLMILTPFEEQLVAIIPSHFIRTITALLQWGKFWHKDGYINVNAKHIATVTKQSKRTVYRHLQQLEKLGLIFEMWKGSNLEYYKDYHGDRNWYKGRNSLFFMPILRQSFTCELTNEIFEWYFVPYCKAACATERANMKDDLYRYRIILELKTDLVPELEIELEEIVDKLKTDGNKLLDSIYEKAYSYYEKVLCGTAEPQDRDRARKKRLDQWSELLKNLRMVECLKMLGLENKVTSAEEFNRFLPEAIQMVQLREESHRFKALGDAVAEKKL